MWDQCVQCWMRYQTSCQAALLSLWKSTGQALLLGSTREAFADEVRQSVLVQWPNRSAG